MNRSPFDPSIALSKDRLDSHSHGAIYVDRFRQKTAAANHYVF